MIIAKNYGDNIITINNIKEAKELAKYKSSILPNNLYEVELEYSESGLVKNINIKEVGSIETTSEIQETNKVALKEITKEEFIKKIEEVIEWANHNGIA